MKIIKSWFDVSSEECGTFTGIFDAKYYQAYYRDGKLHRLDGPAWYSKDHIMNNCWYYYGTRIFVTSQEEFESYLKCLAFE